MLLLSFVVNKFQYSNIPILWFTTVDHLSATEDNIGMSKISKMKNAVFLKKKKKRKKKKLSAKQLFFKSLPFDLKNCRGKRNCYFDYRYTNC